MLFSLLATEKWLKDFLCVAIWYQYHKRKLQFQQYFINLKHSKEIDM